MEQENVSWQEQFGSFRDRLMSYDLMEEMPELAGPMVRQELKLRKKRLEAHGLMEISSLLHAETEPSQYDGSGRMGPGDEKELRRDSYSQQFERRRRYWRHGKRIGSFRELVELRAVMNGVPGSPEAVFHEFLFHDTGDLCQGKKKRLCRWLMLPAVLLAVVGLVLSQDWGGVLMLEMLLLPIYIIVLFSIDIFFNAANIVVNTRHCRKMDQRIGAGRGVLDRLLELDPVMKTGYLVETAMTLARRELYANKKYDAVIDVRYRGFLHPLHIREEKDGLELGLELYVTDLVDDGKRLREQPDLLRLTLRRKGGFAPEEPYTQAKWDRWSLRDLERAEKIK